MFYGIALPLVLLVASTFPLPSFGMANKPLPFLQKGNPESVINTVKDILDFTPSVEIDRITHGKFKPKRLLLPHNPADVLRAALLVSDVELARDLLSRKDSVSENLLFDWEPDFTILAALIGGSPEAIRLLEDFKYFSSSSLKNQTLNHWYKWASEFRLQNPVGAQALIRGMLRLKTQSDDSILHYAIRDGDVEMAKLILLEDPSLLLRKNKDALTPIETAIRLNKRDLANYLASLQPVPRIDKLSLSAKTGALLSPRSEPLYVQVEDSSSSPNFSALQTLEAAPSAFSKQRNSSLAPIAPSFLPKNLRPLKMPKPTGDHATEMQTRITFHQVVSTPGQTIEAIPIETNRMTGRYYSLRKSLPLPNERVTLILAGRGQNAFEPQETDGGRNILLLAGDQEGIAQALVGPRTDVYLIDALFFWGRSLDAEETKLFTTRRIAAFELAGALPSRKDIAVLDDNIEYILFNNGIDFKAEAERAWAHLYTDYMVRDLRTHHLTVIGLREESGKEKDTSNTQIILNRQSNSPVKSLGFGSKVFFFDFEKVKTSARGNFANLFPPLIKMAQEDLYFQIYLKNAGHNVAHVDRRSIRFERHRLQARFAKEVAADVSTWSNDVLKLPGHTENEVRRLSTQTLIEYAEKIIEDARQKKNRQLYTDLVKVQREAMAKNHSSSSSSSTTSSISGQKRKATEAPLPLPPMDTYEGPTCFAEMDSDPAWAAFIQRLVENPDRDSPKKLRAYQKVAIARLSARLQAGERRGYFDMATGTGKTNIFMEIAKVANQQLTGNVAIVLPNKAIKSQTYMKMKEFYESLNSPVQFMSLSSQKDDVPGRTAAESPIVSQGKHILIFCEKTFPIFVRHRKGDLRDFSVLIFDEMHKLEWDSLELIAKFQKHPQGLVLGFSATPGLTQPFFGGNAGKIFQFSSVDGVQTLHEGRSILSPWEMRYIQGSLREDLIQKLPEILKTQEHPNGRKLTEHRGIIYISGEIADADKAANELINSGIPASAYHSGLDEGKNAEIIRKFESGKIQVLVAIYTLREGFDSENVDYIFMAQDKPKTDDVIQMRGRALRPNPHNPDKVALILTVNPQIAEQFSLTNEHKKQALRQSGMLMKDDDAHDSESSLEEEEIRLDEYYKESEATDNFDHLPAKQARMDDFPEEYEEVIEEGYVAPNSPIHPLTP